MKLRLALLSLSAAASVAGVAYAEEPAAAAPAWYDQFTYNAAANRAGAGLVETDPKAAFDFVPSARWGVTLRMRDGEQPILGQPPTGEETSVRAYYQFTPRLRLGGEVMVADGAKEASRESAAPPAARTPTDESQARIRLESAFRF